MSTDGSITFSNNELDRASVEVMIREGEYMVIAGDEKVLASLPAGNWIAGTIPYFMTDNGGKIDQEKLYVSIIRGFSPNNPPRISLYDKNSISRVATEAPDQGFTVLLMPASSDVHLDYARHSPEYPNMYFSPIIGWVAGLHLDELGQKSAKIGFGPASGMLSDTHAVAMHVPLPAHQVANIKTINLFQPGSGPAIKFPSNSFTVNECKIEGKPWALSEYIKKSGIDTRLPLVANYSGVMVNVSIQEVLDKSVNLYAPVFADVEYHFAEPVKDYIQAFDFAIKESGSYQDNIAYSCNCILNFLYSSLEGKKTGNITGPMTFGEIAYQLLNQTLVYMSLEAV